MVKDVKVYLPFTFKFFSTHYGLVTPYGDIDVG